MTKQIYKFYTEWCAPCKAYAPVVEEVCKELGIECISVDAGVDPTLAVKYGITGVPSIVAGDHVIVGMRSKTELKLELRRAGFGAPIEYPIEPAEQPKT